ncbi:hypothetical protein R3P38DRAFT_3296837 [Favolaschia claudopus]|uniref:Uncharacterized protein n=1 Tax=Favolaschia claudopus TaxID=2862362 RepID=A0AAV9Z7K7_9AGAR
MEDDGQGEIEVILRTFNIPGADATVDELREALRDTQLQLARTQVELRAYQTIAQTTSGSKKKLQANPHNYLDAIQALGKSFALMHEPWLSAAVFAARPADGPPAHGTAEEIDAIFKSSKLYNNLLTCTLYEHVPVKFHSLVDASSFPGFKDNFLKYMSIGRSNFVERLKGSWEKLQTESDMKKTPEQFLYFPGDDKSKLPLLSPPIFYSGLKKDAKGWLLNPILPLSLRCLLYGPASIKDQGKAKPTSKTYGVMWNIQELTIESISFVLIAIFFVLSDKDTSFEEKGKTSHIPYQSHFHAHKTRLMKYRNTAGVRNIIRFWSDIVFAGVSRTVTEGPLNDSDAEAASDAEFAQAMEELSLQDVDDGGHQERQDTPERQATPPADDPDPNSAEPEEEELTPISEDEPVAPVVQGRRRGATTRGKKNAVSGAVPEDDNSAADEGEPVGRPVRARGRGKQRGSSNRGGKGRGM